MQIGVNYFAAFREATGCRSERVDSSARTAAELFSECADRHHGLHPEKAALVAVNDTMTDWDVVLSDGDEVLFFPPVAGG
jgi:molybdopterin converting factor subunit 1